MKLVVTVHTNNGKVEDIEAVDFPLTTTLEELVDICLTSISVYHTPFSGFYNHKAHIEIRVIDTSYTDK